MLYLLDTADREAIRACCEFYPVAGVTTNPTIISKEKGDFREIITSIRSIIGPDKMLHVQTTEDEAEAILREAEKIREAVGTAVSALECWIERGVDIAMNEYNPKKPKKPKKPREAEPETAGVGNEGTISENQTDRTTE